MAGRGMIAWGDGSEMDWEWFLGTELHGKMDSEVDGSCW